LDNINSWLAKIETDVPIVAVVISVVSWGMAKQFKQRKQVDSTYRKGICAVNQ